MIRFYDRFLNLCQAEGVKPQSKDMMEVTGVSSPAISNWASKDSIPKTEVLIRLADHFGVSVDYLLGRSDDKQIQKKEAVDQQLSDQELLLLQKFRQTSAEGQFQIIHTCMSLSQKE